MNSRLTRLQSRLAAVLPTSRFWPSPWDLLVEFEQCAGEFAHEPDFPKAVQFYRKALEQAVAADPSLHTLVYGEPNERGMPAVLTCLRIGDQFPDVPAAHEWLREMAWRKHRGIPPVGEAEFAELEAWFEAKEERLAKLADASSLFDVGRGRRTCCWYIREALLAGPRVEGAGEAAEDIRQLQARYGSMP